MNEHCSGRVQRGHCFACGVEHAGLCCWDAHAGLLGITVLTSNPLQWIEKKVSDVHSLCTSHLITHNTAHCMPHTAVVEAATGAYTFAA